MDSHEDNRVRCDGINAITTMFNYLITTKSDSITNEDLTNIIKTFIKYLDGESNMIKSAALKFLIMVIINILLLKNITIY